MTNPDPLGENDPVHQAHTPRQLYLIEQLDARIHLALSLYVGDPLDSSFRPRACVQIQAIIRGWAKQNKLEKEFPNLRCFPCKAAAYKVHITDQLDPQEDGCAE